MKMNSRLHTIASEIGILLLITIIIYYDRNFDFKLGLLVGIFITMVVIDFQNMVEEKQKGQVIEIEANTKISPYQEGKIIKRN